MQKTNTENGARVARLTLLILCTVFISGMTLQFIITKYHTILHAYVAIDILITLPLMYMCIHRIKLLYKTILLENYELSKKCAKLLSAFDVINFGVAIMLPNGSLINVNKKMCRLLGFNQGEVALKDIEKTLQMDELRNNKKFIESLLEKKLEKYQTVMQCKNRNGDQVYMTANISLITNAANQLEYFIIQTQKLFTSKRNAGGKESQKTGGSLSGILNTTELESSFNKAVEMSDNDLTKIVFIALSAGISADLARLIGNDGFQTYLQIFSKRLKNTVRDTDLIGCEDNDKFLICMTNVSQFNAEKIIKNITSNLTSPLIIKGYEIVITTNYGISTFPHDGNDFATLKRNAEIAYRLSKSSSEKNSYYVFNPDCLEKIT